MATPMFALQSVLLPGLPLPLHVFEPRYVAMLDTVIATDRRMGVVLIERGREVGGGDVRCDVATMARVIEARQLPDGRLLVMAVGVHRIRVRRWLPDDPYPLAETEDWPDEPEPLSPEAPEMLRRLSGLVSEARILDSRLRAPRPGTPEPDSVDRGDDPGSRLRAPRPGTPEPDSVDAGGDPGSRLRAPRPGTPEPDSVDLGDDPAEACYRAAALTPLGPLDRYQVLCAPSVNQRLSVAQRVVADAVELLRARIELGTG